MDTKLRVITRDLFHSIAYCKQRYATYLIINYWVTFSYNSAVCCMACYTSASD